jgi:tetratricopeptide (TPR) repeat protein
MDEVVYHHGMIVQRYRKLREWTQPQLAEQWPRSDGGRGVDVRYIRLVESGNRTITDQYVLRKLSELLDIPLWEFGLSEYNPFDPQSLPGHGKRLYDETLDMIELLLNQSLALWRSAPLPVAEQSIRQLMDFFNSFKAHLPPVHLDRRLHLLHAHAQAIQGLMCKRHDEAMKLYKDVRATALDLSDPVLIVHILVILGGEYKRAGNYPDAINALEEARDHSFHGSKQLGAFANGYLAHAYAAQGDILRFERTINTALGIAMPLKDAYGDGTDFVHQHVDDLLLLRSSGYLHLRLPQKALDLLPDQLHIYRAQSLFMLKDIEECINALRAHRSRDRVARIQLILQAMERAGYGDLRVVREFKEELFDC